MAISCYIFEGTWWNNREIPQILPYFQSLLNSGYNLKLSHRTFRNAEDISFYLSKISKDERAFVYFACHGEHQQLMPVGKKYLIENEDLLNALRYCKAGAVEFLHFGCCEMISRESRRQSLENYLEASQAKWVSGYSKKVEWLRSTFLDLALIADLAIPFHDDGKKINVRLSFRGRSFIRDYEQIARMLQFSGAYKNKNGKIELFPEKFMKSL